MIHLIFQTPEFLFYLGTQPPKKYDMYVQIKEPIVFFHDFLGFGQFFMIFQLIPVVLLTLTNYCLHDQVLPPLLEVPPILAPHMVVIFHIFCKLVNFHVVNDFSTDSNSPTHYHHLLLPLIDAKVFIN